jgi:hypothetical protein
LQVELPADVEAVVDEGLLVEAFRTAVFQQLFGHYTV